MTLIQITAILSILMAFGVDTPTVDKVRDILIPPAATSTPIVPVPVIQTPVIQNQPVYFGSTPVVVTPTVEPAPAPVPAPVVVEPPKDTKPPFSWGMELYRNPDKTVRLLIVTDEAITYSLSHGEVTQVIEHAKREPHAIAGDPINGQFRNPYVYSAHVSGIYDLRTVTVTITDEAGNSVQRTLSIRG